MSKPAVTIESILSTFLTDALEKRQAAAKVSGVPKTMTFHFDDSIPPEERKKIAKRVWDMLTESSSGKFETEDTDDEGCVCNMTDEQLSTETLGLLKHLREAFFVPPDVSPEATLHFDKGMATKLFERINHVLAHLEEQEDDDNGEAEFPGETDGACTASREQLLAQRDELLEQYKTLEVKLHDSVQVINKQASQLRTIGKLVSAE